MFCAFADCIRHTTRFADAYAYTPFAITDDDNGTEGESTATLNHFRHALNIDDTFVEFFAVVLTRGALVTVATWFVVAARTTGAIPTGFVATGFSAPWTIATTGTITARTIATASITAAACRLFLWLVCHRFLLKF
jgi:hypothetical protein